MKKLLIFDPPQCCSTGVCGPDIDPALVQFAADLKWLGTQGIAVERFNLGQQPEVFAQNEQVLKIINEAGTDVLPLIMREGMVVSHTRYPSRAELAQMAGVTNGTASQGEEHAVPVRKESIFTEAVAELVAIGAAVASNCEACFEYHYNRASALGVSREDMIRAVNMAQTVKDKPAQEMLLRATRTLNPEQLQSQNGGCCGNGEECC